MLGFDKQFEDWDWTCFEKDAKISTEVGIKNIQDIKVGDSVLSFNEESHKFEYKKVLRLFEREIEKVIHIKLSNGQIMKVTEGHRIWVNPS